MLKEDLMVLLDLSLADTDSIVSITITPKTVVVEYYNYLGEELEVTIPRP